MVYMAINIWMDQIKKVLSKWAEVQKVTVKTSLVTGKPAVKSAKVSRQGTKRKVTVKFTVPKSL